MKEMCALCTVQGSRETPWVPTLQHKKSLQDFPGSTVNEAWQYSKWGLHCESKSGRLNIK